MDLPDAEPTMPGQQSPNGHQPMPSDQLVPTQPVPVAYDLLGKQFRTPEGLKWMVEIAMYMPTGKVVTYWDAQSAKRFAADIRAAAAEVGRRESGIIIASADQMPPDPPTTRR